MRFATAMITINYSKVKLAGVMLNTCKFDSWNLFCSLHLSTTKQLYPELSNLCL